MGLEANCSLRLGRETFAGKAHLDTDKLTFRGGARLDLALKAIKSAEVGKGGALALTHDGPTATLLLSDRATAEKWALKIRYPRSLVDKLGLKSGSRAAVIGIDDPAFLRDATERIGAAPATKLGNNLDFIFYAADSAAELAKLKTLKSHLQPAGAIWVVSRKGKAATIKDVDVMAAGRAAGLVDNKTCSFSDTHTALRLVIPLAARPK
jgi:hypothetical protein